MALSAHPFVIRTPLHSSSSGGKPFLEARIKHCPGSDWKDRTLVSLLFMLPPPRRSILRLQLLAVLLVPRITLSCSVQS